MAAAGAGDEETHKIPEGCFDAAASPRIVAESEKVQEREIAVKGLEGKCGRKNGVHAVIEGMGILANEAILVLVPQGRTRRRGEDGEGDFRRRHFFQAVAKPDEILCREVGVHHEGGVENDAQLPQEFNGASVGVGLDPLVVIREGFAFQ